MNEEQILEKEVYERGADFSGNQKGNRALG